jgi:hypothetical protein
MPHPQTSFTELYIVSELMDVDLHTLLHKKHEELSPDHIQSFAYQILCGVKCVLYIHINLFICDNLPTHTYICVYSCGHICLYISEGDIQDVCTVLLADESVHTLHACVPVGVVDVVSTDTCTHHVH